jgi:hypothetical protein
MMRRSKKRGNLERKRKINRKEDESKTGKN